MITHDERRTIFEAKVRRYGYPLVWNGQRYEFEPTNELWTYFNDGIDIGESYANKANADAG